MRIQRLHVWRIAVAGIIAFAGALCIAQTASVSAPIPVHTDAEYAEQVDKIKLRVPLDGGFTVVVEKPFVIAGNDTPAKVENSDVQIVRWTVQHIKKDFFAKDPTDIIDIYLLKDKTSYDQFTKQLFNDNPETPYGYYSPEHQAIIMNMATGGGTLVHEIVHPYMAANFPKCPAWFNEGLASLYEQSEDKDGHIWGLPNWRLPDLQETLRGIGPKEEGKAPAFKDLCAMDAATFYGAGKGRNYGVARYLCMYLQNQGVLRQFYRDFVSNQEKDPTGYQTLQTTLAGLGEMDMEVFRKKWEAWVMTMKYP